MSEVSDAIAAAAATGGDSSQGGGDQQQQQQQNAAPAWTAALPDDMRSDATVMERLSRYPDVGAAAKGLIETEKWATGRVKLPAPGDEAARAEFYSKVRPADAADYKFAMPEGAADGQPAPLVEAFRPVAHRIGLDPYQAEEISKWWNGQQAEAIGAQGQAAKDELKALELELNPIGYGRRMAATEAMLRNAGIDADAALPGLEQAIGARKTMEFLFAMAERTGELEKVDGDALALRSGAMDPKSAQQTIDRKMDDKAFMAKAFQQGTPEAEEWKRLQAAAAAPVQR